MERLLGCMTGTIPPGVHLWVNITLSLYYILTLRADWSNKVSLESRNYSFPKQKSTE